MIRIINAILAFIDRIWPGKKLTRAAIVRMTRALHEILKKQLTGDNDETLRRHVLYVFNQTLMLVKDFDLTEDDLEKLFKYYRRLYMVLTKYGKSNDPKERGQAIALSASILNFLGDISSA